eukprot:2131657-Pyramimonas_sp.AAC.3
MPRGAGERAKASCGKLGAQLTVLTAKNVIILWRRKISTLLRLLVPAAAVILALILKNTVGGAPVTRSDFYHWSHILHSRTALSVYLSFG